MKVLPALIITLMCASCPCMASPPDIRPNVIVIISDALRRDHLSCYGYHRNTSPNIDSFAEEATLYDNAFAQAPATKPSVASIFTSRYVVQHNMIDGRYILPDGFVTLAEFLKNNGYITAGFLENYILGLASNYQQGFDTWIIDERRNLPDNNDVTGDNFDAKIKAWVRANSDAPFFLYLHYIDPHHPYGAPGALYNSFNKDYRGKIKGDENLLKIRKLFASDKKELDHLISLYDSEILYMDTRFGAFIKHLKKLGLYDKTLIIFTSDHGEAFLEHGMLEHGGSLNAEQIIIPFIMKLPDPSGRGRSGRYVQHIDIFPTIASILSLDTSRLHLEGNDIFREKSADNIKIVSEHLGLDSKLVKFQDKNFSKRPKPTKDIIAQRLHADKDDLDISPRQRSIIYRGWKLIHNIYQDRYALYNIKQDPLESDELHELYPRAANALRSHLDKWKRETRVNETFKKDGKRGAPPLVIMDEEFRAKLKSLGYLQ